MENYVKLEIPTGDSPEDYGHLTHENSIIADTQLLDELTNLEELTLEHSRLFEALVCSDMSDDPTLVAEKLHILGVSPVEITHENSVKLKDGIIEAVKRGIARNKAAREESIGAIDGLWKKITGAKIKGLIELRDKLKASDSEASTKAISKGNAKSINNKLGYFTSIGKDINNIKDLVEQINAPLTMTKTIIKENIGFANAEVGNNWGNFTEEFDKSQKFNAPHSVKFLKSINNVEYKDINLIIGYPMKLFAKHLSFVVVYGEENKVKVDNEVVEVKHQNVEPLSIKDSITLLDEAIRIIEASASTSKIIKGLVDTLDPYKYNPTVINSTIVATPATTVPHFNTTMSYFLPLVTTIKNLYMDYYEVKNFVNLRVISGIDFK